MARETFRPEDVRTDSIVDSRGRRVGRLLATRYDESGDHVASLVLELDEDVRRDRLVKDERVEVAAWAVDVVHGEPRLTLTLDELFDDQGVSHAGPGSHPKKPERRPDHFGAPADPNRAPGPNDVR